MIVFSVSTYVKPKGAASAQNALSRISDSRGTLYTGISSGPRQDRADALEVGKSPTEVPPGTRGERRLPVAPPSRGDLRVRFVVEP
jgi:hypothetical protein